MASNTQKTSIAGSYASSLLELANEQKQAEPIGLELEQIGQVLKDNPTFAQFLADPAIGKAAREAAIKSIFAGRVSPLVANFLGVVNEKGRAALLSLMVQEYRRLLDSQLGKINVDVTVATPLTPQQLDDVRRKISVALKKEAIVRQNLDDSIIGGIILRVQDKMFDASVKTQLAAMKEQLLAAAGK